MLLSHRHNFLFVHLAKTGGTSIRAALRRGRWLDPYSLPTIACHRVSHLLGHRIGCKIPRHAPIIVAKEMLPPEQFIRFFKFAFVRNPWDRMVSAYSHFQRERRDLLTEHRLTDFSRFVNWLLEIPVTNTRRAMLVEALRRPQRDHLIDLEGRVLVDFIGRYENLENDFQRVVQRLSVRGVRLPHKRRGQRRGDYRGHFTDANAERVAEHFSVDLRKFGYRFDPPRESQPSEDLWDSGLVARTAPDNCLIGRPTEC